LHLRAGFFPEQERLGASLLGIFRDDENLDRFVWLRVMPNMDERKRILTAFYTDGEMWQKHRNITNTYIVDSDNVLLIKPVSEIESKTFSTSNSVIEMYTLIQNKPLSKEEAVTAEKEIETYINDSKGTLVGTFSTENVENNYPRHAIRSNEYGLVWFASFNQFTSGKLPSYISKRKLIPSIKSKMR
jgi:hypothetical protein